MYLDTAHRFGTWLGASWVRHVTWTIAFIGAGLRAWQYAAGTSLWLDELAVAQNVVSRPIGELLARPLAWDQVAPKGFLLAEKLAVALWGANEYGLRFFPFLCSIVALFLFVRVAEFMLGHAAPIAVALFATAGPLIDYAARVKQYSIDVAAAVLLLWVALELQRRERSVRELHGAGIIGAVAVWFSQPAALVLAGLGAALVVIEWYRRDLRSLGRLWPLLLWWGGSAAGATAASFASVTAGTRHSIMATYDLWKWGVPPDSLPLAIKSLWPLHRLTALLAPGSLSSLGYPFAPLYLLLALFGAYALWRRSWPVALLIFAPFLPAVAVAVARLYPFSDRLILFLLPGFFLGAAAGIDLARAQISRLSSHVGVAAVLLLTGPAVLPIIEQLPPYRIDDIKPALSYLEQQRLRGDIVYVYYDAVPAMGFYAREFGLGAQDYTSGGCHRGDTRSYLLELDRFRGQRRVWLLLLYAHTGAHLRDDILHYLGTIGRRLDSFIAPSKTISGLGSPATLYLYDLSDRQRLKASSVSSFPISGGKDLISCDIGPIAMSRNPQFAR